MVPLTPVYHVLRVSSIIWTGVVCCIDVSVQKPCCTPCTDWVTTGCNCFTARRTASVPRVPSLPSVRGCQRRFPPICIKNTFSLYRIHLYLQKCILRGTIKFVSVRSSWCFTIISPKNLDAIESLTNVPWRPLIFRLHWSYLVYQHSEFPL